MAGRRKVAATAVALGLAAGAAGAAERFPQLKPDEMTPAQKSVADRIVSGPRKSMGGPFNAWLHFPQFACQPAKSLRRSPEDFSCGLPPGARFVRTSPRSRSGALLPHGSALLIASTTEQLRQLESRFFAEVLGQSDADGH